MSDAAMILAGVFLIPLIPAQAGIQVLSETGWVPASAGASGL
jgi:hypothetical protein